LSIVTNSQAAAEQKRKFLANYRKVRDLVHQEVIGLDDVIEFVFIGMLADGHVILEGEPGVGKTLVARTIAKTINVPSSYVQFTPETMPSDLFYSMDFLSGAEDLKTFRDMTFRKGPIFSPIVIGDEINRAIPRIHGALLAPLEEKIIALEGEIHELGPFYFWIATQNPIESTETTSQLPEALQERFLLMIRMAYPAPELLRKITVHDTRPKAISPVFEKEEIVSMRDIIFEQYVAGHQPDSPIVSYIQRLVNAVHSHPAVRSGPGIRAAQDLIRTAAAHAFLHESERITFADIKAVALPVLRFKFIRDSRLARRYHLPLVHNDDVVRDVLSCLDVVV
jgi:MoxR-like ATPase